MTKDHLYRSDNINQAQFLLILAWISGMIIWFFPSTGGWIILINILPWLYGLVRRNIRFHPTTFPILIVLFIFTALVGVWAAYDQQAALNKFWILLSGVTIFGALLLTRPGISSIAHGLVSLTVGFLAVYFMLSHNWETQPADFDLITRVGVSWMSIRLAIPSIFDNANIPAGIIAVMLPMVWAFFWISREKKQYLSILISSVCLVLGAIAILMSSSRAIWGILGLGLAVWIWWGISKGVSGKLRLSHPAVYLTGLLLVAIASLTLLYFFIVNTNASTTLLPGSSSISTRSGLFHQAIDLLPDFWLTGGGLQSFAGLYSQYILVIPFLFYKYAHNLFLDITLEQGVFGLVAFLGIYGATLAIQVGMIGKMDNLAKHQRVALLATVSALVVFLGHGLVDDSFYGVQGTPFLFIIPGIVIASGSGSAFDRPSLVGNKIFSGILLAGLLLVGLIVLILPSLSSSILANVGAVNMAKLELAGYPRGSWDDGLAEVDFQEVKKVFLAALNLDPDQRTANHRLGLIALQSEKFSEAVQYLEQAHQNDPSHPGIRKALGYSYVWLGEFEAAYKLMYRFPEIPGELDSYRHYWKHQGNEVFAANAQKMLTYWQVNK